MYNYLLIKILTNVQLFTSNLLTILPDSIERERVRDKTNCGSTRILKPTHAHKNVWLGKVNSISDKL